MVQKNVTNTIMATVYRWPLSSPTPMIAILAGIKYAPLAVRKSLILNLINNNQRKPVLTKASDW